jgi:hypothetical protein
MQWLTIILQENFVETCSNVSHLFASFALVHTPCSRKWRIQATHSLLRYAKFQSSESM